MEEESATAAAAAVPQYNLPSVAGEIHLVVGLTHPNLTPVYCLLGAALLAGWLERALRSQSGTEVRQQWHRKCCKI